MRAAALRFAQTSTQQPAASLGSGNGGTSFGDTLKQALDQVSSTQDNAQDIIQSFLRGDQVELHQVMAATEEAGIALLIPAWTADGVPIGTQTAERWHTYAVWMVERGLIPDDLDVTAAWRGDLAPVAATPIP